MFTPNQNIEKMKKEEAKKKSKKKLYILLGAGAGLLGLTALGIWWYKSQKREGAQNEDDLLFKLTDKKEEASQEPGDAPRPAKAPAKEKTTFPLKKGDRGAFVKTLQEELIKKYGPQIFSGRKATGFYGDETARILKEKGYPAVIDKAAFEKIVSGGGRPDTTNSVPPQEKKSVTVEQAVPIATNIWKSATLRKLPDMIAELRKLNSPQDYTTVNNLFLTIRTRGVRQTIVNAALSSFSDDDTARQMIVQEFLRMGLKYDGKKWSLAGVPRKQLLTTQATTIRNQQGIGLDIPENTLLGEAISSIGQITTFRTIDGEVLYVPTKHVSHV